MYRTRLVMAFLGGAVFATAVVLAFGEVVPTVTDGGGLGAAAIAAGLGFGTLMAAFVRRD